MKRLYALLFAICILVSVNVEAYAQEKVSASTPQIVKETELKSINTFLQEFISVSNSKKLDELSKLYDSSYISGDGLKKDQLMKLVKETWDNYPNIKYSTEIKNIRVNGNLAAIESIDRTDGVTSQKSNITNDTGKLESISHSVLYLQRFGKNWKVISDHIYYEKTFIKYGSAKQLNISFYAPEQVFAGESYTATLKTEVPSEMIAMGAITREPIVITDAKPKEIFRQISPDNGLLERVMKTNTTNNNELAAASVGFTELVEDQNANPDIKITGVALLMQRINVIPKSNYVDPVPATEQVKEEESSEPAIEDDLQEDLFEENPEK